jgi:hypothetical protein
VLVCASASGRERLWSPYNGVGSTSRSVRQSFLMGGVVISVILLRDIDEDL